MQYCSCLFFCTPAEEFWIYEKFRFFVSSGIALTLCVVTGHISSSITYCLARPQALRCLPVPAAKEDVSQAAGCSRKAAMTHLSFFTEVASNPQYQKSHSEKRFAHLIIILLLLHKVIRM